MKILITTDWYKPVINGVVTSVENLERGLTQAGHDVRILTLSGTRRSHREQNVYYVGSLNAGKIYPNARLKLKVPRAMLQEILDWGPDVVHSQCEFSTFFVAKSVARRCHIPLVHTYHTVYEDFTHYFCPSPMLGKKVAEVLSRRVLAETNGVIVPSVKIEALLQRYRVETPLYVVPTGIRMDVYQTDRSARRAEIRRELGIGQGECILLSIGRVAREKNLDELVEFLRACGPSQRMLIVGDGPYREELTRKAESLGIRNQLIFTGMVSPEQVPDYYAAGDIFVSASTSETQGLTYMEAMASGLPLLCRADDCLRDVIQDGENGMLYHSQAEFLAALARLKGDFAFRNQLGLMARRSIQKNFSVQAFAASCVRVYTVQCRRQRAKNG